MENRPQLTRIQLAEATAAAVLASAIISTAGGVFWLIVTLPQKLTILDQTVATLTRTLTQIDERVQQLETKVTQQDQRLIRLEVRR